MKIQDAKKAYAAQMDTLWTRKRDLSQALKNCQQGGAPNVDRVEISRELSAVDAQYNEAQGVMESIIERETAISTTPRLQSSRAMLCRRPQRRWARCWRSTTASPPAAKSLRRMNSG